MSQRLKDLERENNLIRDQLIQKPGSSPNHSHDSRDLSPHTLGRRKNYISKDKFEDSIADVMRTADRKHRALLHDVEASSVPKAKFDETVRQQQAQIDELKLLLKRRSTRQREDVLLRQHRKSTEGGSKSSQHDVPLNSEYESGNSEAEYDALTANLDRLDQLKRQLSTPTAPDSQGTPQSTKSKLLAAAKNMSIAAESAVDGADDSRRYTPKRGSTVAERGHVMAVHDF